MVENRYETFFSYFPGACSSLGHPYINKPKYPPVLTQYDI